MTASVYSEAIRRVLLSEGGYVNNAQDPGGETNFGITIKVARENGYQGDMRALPLDVAKRIYRFKYANPVHFDEDPTGLDYTLLDYAVNSGVSRANKVVRRVCSLPDTAMWPDLSIALAKRDPKAVISSVNAERLKFLQGLKTWPAFGKGWGARVRSVAAVSLYMATMGTPLPPILPPGNSTPSQGKGQVTKPATAGPIVVGGTSGGAVTSQVTDHGTWVMAHPFISLLILVASLAVILALAEFLARTWQAYQQDAPTPGLILVPETKR